MTTLGDHGVLAIEQAISALDPEGRYVRLNSREKLVEYSPEIETGEQINSYEGEEEPCRAFIVAWLCTDGGYLPTNITLEKRYSIGRPKIGAELDILIKHANGDAYALIEVKSPIEYPIDQNKYIQGQLFNIAPHEQGASVLVYATVTCPRVTLPPTSIQRERDSGFEFCLFGRVGQRGLARSFAGCAASGPVAV